MLKASNLWIRELWYLDSIAPRVRSVGGVGEEIRLPPPPNKLEGQVKIPRGWIRVPAQGASEEQKSEEVEFFDELLDRAWGVPYALPQIRENEYWNQVSVTGFEASFRRYLNPRDCGLVKRLGFKKRYALRSRSVFYNLPVPVSERMVWVRCPRLVDEEDVVDEDVTVVATMYPPPRTLDPSWARYLDFEDAAALYM